MHYRKKMKNLYIYIYINNIFIYIYITVHNLQGRKSYKKSSKLNVILSDLTFLIDRVAWTLNKS